MYALDARVLALTHGRIRWPNVKKVVLAGSLENCRNVPVISGMHSSPMTQKEDFSSSDTTI